MLVMATPLTLRQEKFERLMELYGEGAVRVPCPGLMELVEADEDRLDMLMDLDAAGDVGKTDEFNALREQLLTAALARQQSSGEFRYTSKWPAELKQKGVEGETAEIALEQRTDDDERNDAHELVRKKLRPSMDLADRQEKDKIMRRLVAMLARKGYPSGLAFSVVKQEIETYMEENGIENSSSGSYYD